MSHHFRALVVEIACEMFGVEKILDIESLVPDEAKNWNTKKKGSVARAASGPNSQCHISTILCSKGCEGVSVAQWCIILCDSTTR